MGWTNGDTGIVNGVVFTQKITTSAGRPTRNENGKIGLIQFCLSAPKTNMEGSITINDYTQMDRILREEKTYILNLCKAIQKTGCNVLLIQKSILRDAVNELSLAFLAKMKILVVKDIEREEIEFVSKTLGCQPAASIESFTADKLGAAKLVQEEPTSDGKIVKITGVPSTVKTVSILVRGSNKLVLGEADRSLHDALCVVRCLVKQKYLIAGGAAPEIELAIQLSRWAKTLSGLDSYCISEYANALEVVPYTLAENAGLHPIQVVTELRNRHDKGERNAGISVRKGTVADMVQENVIQPLLVSTSMLRLATETVAMILKIDDIVACR